MNFRALVRPNVLRLRAYEAKDIPCRVKLDANESPIPFLKGMRTNRYPDPGARGLKEAFSKYLGSPVRPANILAGNGSDELIYYLITTFGGPVLYPTPTFSMYGIIGKAVGEKTLEVPLDREFDLDLKGMLSAVKKERPKLVFLSSPNNPTGNCFSADRMLRIIAASRGIVIVDEAYQPFSSKGAASRGFLPFLKDRPNLLIMRTLSKVGLAALRVGFLIGAEGIITEVNKVRLPFNVNAVSQDLASEALRDKKRFRSLINSISRERDRLYGKLLKVKGLQPYPSEANFILFKVKDAERVYAGLLKKGVLVRNMKGVVDSCLRVTVGTERENNAFLRALEKVI